MKIFKEFAEAGLIKKKIGEQYIDSQETTTTANVDGGISPFVDKEEKDDEQNERYDSSESEEKIDDYIEMIECAQRLNAAYKKIAGKDLHELYCPKCKPNDMSSAFDSDGNNSAIDNTFNMDKNEE